MAAPQPNGSNGSDRADGSDGAGSAQQRPLRTEPRPLWMHVMVDGLIGFCATALVLAFFGTPLWVMIVVGWLIGLAVAPFTRRLDERQLSDRSRSLDDEATKG